MVGPSHIAVLGGGITGLSSTFHLSRRFPKALVTLIEKRPTLGGWIQSETVRIPSSGGDNVVVIEGGPRTLRPDAKSVLELVNLLGLNSSVIVTSKTSPAAKSRFIHIPGTPGLLQLPSTMTSLVRSPFRTTLLLPVLREPLKPPNRPKNISDESVDSFFTRRFGEQFARMFGSALVHGIYATDSRTLSMRAAFPALWDAEEKGWGSVIRGYMLRRRNSTMSEKRDYELGDTPRLLKDASIYSFRDGMQTLTGALEQYLSSQSNVNILRNAGVTSLQLKQDKSSEVSMSSGAPITPSHVVSALPLPILQTILPATNSLPHLTANPSSSVVVVNLVFPGKAFDLHPEGFGYLIARPRSDYSSACSSMLGTVFDSCCLSSQDSSTRLTKLTVMMGGPHSIPDDDSLTISSVMRDLKNHLQRHLPDPVFHKIRRHQNCIPTPTPYHLIRIAEMKTALQDNFDGRLEVVGAGVDGVSIGDCVEAGKRVGAGW